MTVLLLFPLMLAATSTEAETSTVGDTRPVTTLGVEDLEGLDEEPKTNADRSDAASIEAHAQKETVVDEIEVSAQRVSEAAKPDTQLRVTGKQLIERGVTNLAQALDLISDTPIRVAGRGGFQSDIR